MTNRKSLFRFKRFDCRHADSTMKIGVDAVLIASWADLRGAGSILDVGCGCGVIALICAQRNPDALIEAIDIDERSVLESRYNFLNSPWIDRLQAEVKDFARLRDRKFDVLISNPPYFASGIDKPDTARLKARHEDSLSPVTLLKEGRRLLNPGGSVAMVIPSDRFSVIEQAAEDFGYRLARGCKVRGLPTAPFKRLLLQYVLTEEETGEKRHGIEKAEELPFEELTLETVPGSPTEQHRKLCGDLYLKF